MESNYYINTNPAGNDTIFYKSLYEENNEIVFIIMETEHGSKFIGNKIPIFYPPWIKSHCIPLTDSKKIKELDKKRVLLGIT